MPSNRPLPANDTFLNEYLAKFAQQCGISCEEAALLWAKYLQTISIELIPCESRDENRIPVNREFLLDKRMANQFLWQVYHALGKLEPPPRPGSELRRIMDEIEAAAASNWWRA